MGYPILRQSQVTWPGPDILKFYTVLCQLLFVRDLRANGKMVGPQGISQPKEYCNCANSMDRETRWDEGMNMYVYICMYVCMYIYIMYIYIHTRIHMIQVEIWCATNVYVYIYIYFISTYTSNHISVYTTFPGLKRCDVRILADLPDLSEPHIACFLEPKHIIFLPNLMSTNKRFTIRPSP